MTDYTNILPDELVVTREPADTSCAPRSWQTALLFIDGNDVSIKIREHYSPSDGVSPDEWHQCILTYLLADSRHGACALNIYRLRKALADGGSLSTLIDRVIAGHKIVWNGNNDVGRFNTDAEEANEELDGLGDDYTDDTEVWDAEQWLVGDQSPESTLRAMDLDAEATEEEIKAAAKLFTNEAKADGIIITGNMTDAIHSIIEQAKEDALED